MSNLLTRDVLENKGLENLGGFLEARGDVVHPALNRNNSNRCSFCIRNVFPSPTIEMSPRIGIDKIAVEIPLATGMGDPVSFLSQVKNTLMGRWATKATTRHLSTGSVITWQFLKTSWSIRLELNPSRFVDPDGYSLASPISTVRVIEEVIREYMFESDAAVPLFAVNEEGDIDVENWSEDWPNMLRISRLDTTVDFQIDSDEFNFEYYKEVRPKYAKGVQITYGKDGRAETWNGIYSSKDGFVQMYDKSAQIKKTNPAALPSGRVTRFEYRLERKWLARTHIHTLHDVNQVKFENALRVGWEASKAGSTVNNPNDWEQSVHNSDLSHIEKLELINYLRSGDIEKKVETVDEKGFDWTKLSKRAGISLAKPLNHQWQRAMYLDLNSQSLVFI